MLRVTDQMDREVVLNSHAQRIVSTVPSQTELLCDLGLKHRLVGRTRFCIHPRKELKPITDIGGTKQLKLDVIHELKPDLVIANKEENEKSDILELEKHYPIYISDVNDVASALGMMGDIGTLTGSESLCTKLRAEISLGFQDTPTFKGSVAYLIWYQPYMAAGNNTYIHNLLEHLGLRNALVDTERYPELSSDKLLYLNPDHIFLSSEPFPFKEKHVLELQEIVPNAKITLVDGEMFSWYGSRMLKAIPYFKSLYKKLQ